MHVSLERTDNGQKRFLAMTTRKEVVTVTTTHGHFTIEEQDDGALVVSVTGIEQLAVAPRSHCVLRLYNIRPGENLVQAQNPKTP